MKQTRRQFLGGAAATFVAGCRTAEWFGAPKLAFGVVSDVHVTTPRTAKLTRRAFEYFKSRGADAVMVPGDLTDWGLKSSLSYVADAWKAVFAGTETVPLFCTGNHDFDGWWYGDMTMEMHANGYSEDDRLILPSMAESWKAAFGEDYAGIRCRTVKGYDFISVEYRDTRDFPAWMAKNGARFRGGKPFFFFQHVPIKGTTPDSNGWCDGGVVKPVLKDFPNCIAFTGHEHSPFADDRMLWRGEFTAVSIPSLSYACPPGGCENTGGPRNGKCEFVMPRGHTRRDLRGGEGFYVSVYDEKMVIERVDFDEDCRAAGEAWIVPFGKEGVAELAKRAAASAAPAFPAGAEFDTETRNTEDRQGKWAIAMNCEFPSAVCADGARVHHYEIRAVRADGKEAMVKKFCSPAYSYAPWREPKSQRFWFDVKDLPQGAEYFLEVRAFNCWGKASAPLRSKQWRGVPGGAEIAWTEVVLTFDDNATGHITTAAPILEKYGFRGVFNVITDCVGREKHLTWDQVRELKKRGHEIASHGKSHVNMFKLFEQSGEAAVMAEFRESMAAIEKELGEKPKYFCPPFVAYDDGTAAMCAKAGMKLMPAPRRNWGKETTPEAFGRYLDELIAKRPQKMDLLFHGVEPTTGWNPLGEGVFEGCMKELKKRVDQGSILVRDAAGFFGK